MNLTKIKEINKTKLKVVLLHGNSSSLAVFDGVKAHIDIDLYGIEFPGHGDSIHSTTPEIDYSIGNIRNQLIEKLKAIGSPFIIVGNSLGGHMAIEVADKLDQLAGIVLLGTSPLKKPLNIEEAFYPVEILNYYFDELVEDKNKEKVVKGAVYGDKLYPVLLNDFNKTDPKFRKYFTQTIGDLLDEHQIIKNLNKPVYVIQGKQDPSVNIEYVKSLPGITKIYEIDECGHYPSLEQPEKFAEIINEIIKKF